MREQFQQTLVRFKTVEAQRFLIQCDIHNVNIMLVKKGEKEIKKKKNIEEG